MRYLLRPGPARRLPALILAALGAVVTACVEPGPQLGGRPAHLDDPTPQLQGTNWDGEPFALEELQGRVTIVFFGYTYCPDICPMTLAKMKQLYGHLGEASEEVAVVFASVDPKRDSVEKLSQYVPNFDPRFYGVHLDKEELDAAKESFDLAVQFSQPQEGPGTDSYYYVDHTGSYFLLDRSGTLRVTFPPNATVEEMLPDVRTLLEA